MNDLQVERDGRDAVIRSMATSVGRRRDRVGKGGYYALHYVSR